MPFRRTILNFSKTSKKECRQANSSARSQYQTSYLQRSYYIQKATREDMSIKKWLKHNLYIQTPNHSERVYLVGRSDENIQPITPYNAGPQFDRIPRRWSISKINSILIDAKVQPSAATFLAARQARHQLLLFWVATPVDLFEELYNSKLGSLQRTLLEHPLLLSNLSNDEKAWRHA